MVDEMAGGRSSAWRIGKTVIGVAAAMLYLVIIGTVVLVSGLAGGELHGTLIPVCLLGVPLTPLVWIALSSIRRHQSRLSYDPLLWGGLVMLLSTVLLRLFDVGAIGGALLLPVLVFIFVSAPLVSSIVVFDIIKWRSPRLLMVLVPFLLALFAPSPQLGFALARDCLDEQVEIVLADVEAEGSGSVYHYSGAPTGRCGTVTWWRTTFDDEHGRQIRFSGAGGVLGSVESLMWSETPVANCQDTEIYFCGEITDLGDGWYAYTKRSAGAT